MRAACLLLLLVMLGLPFQARAAACGGEIPCAVAGGSYRVELPEGKPVGVYVFFHGYMASARSQMQNRALVKTVLSHHLAFAALDGVDGSWSIPDGPVKARDDQAYVRAVLEDLRQRFGFTASNRLLGGFSLGASMAWYTACQQGDQFAAMLTFSGVFWNPLPQPEDCTTALPTMIHIHGRADRTFPLEGRAIGDHFHQGDTRKSIAIYRARATCDLGKMREVTLAGISCDAAPGCIRGESLLCLHAGGHQVRLPDLDAALGRLFPGSR